MKTCLSVIVACLLLTPVISSGQDKTSADEIAALKAEVAALKATIESLKSNLAAVESERDALRLRVNRIEKDAAKVEVDLFQVGTRWEGSRFLSGSKTPRDNGQKWRLVITERDGEKFKGQIQFVSRDEQAQQVEVTGTAPSKENGRVVFKTTVVGVLQQSFEGILKANQISLTWEGTGVAGRKIGGTANLSR